MNRAQSRVRGKVPTAAVLLSGVGDPYQMGLMKGIDEAAKAAGVSLLCFVGGTLPLDTESSAKHRVYDLCGPHNVDGVILLASTLSRQVGPAALALHCERYKPLPILSIGADFEGAAAITVDNHVGMHGAICHLIEVHGARRIAFVQGPKANAEAEIRLNAYRAALDEHGIAFEPELVLPGDFSSESGVKAGRALFDVRGARLEGVDAIGSANDSMALGVLSVLEERGIQVPERVRIVGFDDVEEGRLTRSPLTTVRQPLEKVGRQALRSFLEWVQFGEKPAATRVDTDFVVRRSCGCGGLAIPADARRGTTPRLSVEAALMVHRQHIVDGLTRVARGSFGAAGADWQARVFNAIASDVRQAESPDLVRVLQEVMEKISPRGVDLTMCDELLSTLRRQVLESIGDHPEARARLEDSFHASRLAISETLRRNLAREHLQLAGWTRTLSSACAAISSAFEPGRLAARIREELPRLGIQSCFVVMYDREPSSGVSRLLGGFDQRSGHQLDGGNKFSAKMLAPPDLIDARDARSFVITPLTWKTRRLGHVLIELDIDHAFAYGPIAEAISTAMRGAELSASSRSDSVHPPVMVAPS